MSSGTSYVELVLCLTMGKVENGDASTSMRMGLDIRHGLVDHGLQLRTWLVERGASPGSVASLTVFLRPPFTKS